MKKLFYVSNALPNEFTGGSDLLALNLLKELKKKFSITVVSIGSNYCTKNELKLIHKNLRKLKFRFIEIKKNLKFAKDPVTLKNFIKTDYVNINNVEKAKEEIKKINLKKKDILLSFGSASIDVCSEINCNKIAIHEDVQDQVFILREKFLINRFNFIKKIIKIIMLKIHFRNYYEWLKLISNNYKINYTFSEFDHKFLKKFFEISVLPVPMILKIKKKKNFKIKSFIISMFSSNMAQDFNGIKILYYKLIPHLKEKKLLNKCKFYLVMKKPSYLPHEIKKIISDKLIKIKKYNDAIINSTNLLFYPSNYPVGFRSKILFAFSKSIFVATSATVKKCIPELENNKNCLMSNNLNTLNHQISNLINNPKKFKYLIKSSYFILKKYSSKRAFDKILKDMNKLSFTK